MKATNRAYHLSALALQGIALILEILPIGAVMVFATSPTKQNIEVYSYFSLLPVVCEFHAAVDRNPDNFDYPAWCNCLVQI